MIAPELTLGAAARVLRESGLRRSLYVYFIQIGDDGPVKIGAARDPRARLGTLQVGSPEPLHLRAVWWAFDFEEKDLHAQFAADRIRGEWFRPSDELTRTIEAFAPGLSDLERGEPDDELDEGFGA